MKIKRILIINSTQIGENSGTGNTLQNIFTLLPKDNLLQLIMNPLSPSNSSDINTIFAPDKICRLPYAISKYREKRRLKRQQNSKEHSLPMQYSNINIPKKGIHSILHEVINGIFDSWPLQYQSLYAQIDAFKPEVIYTCAASIRIMKTTEKLARRYHIPVVVHLMDDWPNSIYSSSILSLPFRKYALHMLDKLYNRSTVNCAISDALASKYETIYHKKQVALMNPVAIRKCPQSTSNKHQTIRFLYAGSLSLQRDKSLKILANTLRNLEQQGYSNNFDIYTAPLQNTKTLQQEFAALQVKIHNYVSTDKVFELYNNYDVLVFTESFLPEYIRFTTYSLSTKIPEYLASGVPILAYVPAVLFSSQYLAQSKAAAVATDENELADACKKLIVDKAYRQCLSNNGYKLAIEKHSIEYVSKTLEKIFEMQ